MTAPDTRDSVERFVADLRQWAENHERKAETVLDDSRKNWHEGMAQAFEEAADRLSALPQQAGGEDAKVRHLMKARDIALGAVQELQAEVARLREAELDAKRWRSFRKTRSIRAEGLTPEHWDAREDAHIAAAEADAYNIDAAIGGTGDA